MSKYTWPVTMLEEYEVPADILVFFQGFVEGSEDKSKKLEELNSEHQLLKDTSAKQERYIAELEKQIGILQKTLDLVDKNKQHFIVKPKAASSADIADMFNMGPVILNTGTESIIPIYPEQWIPVTERLPEVVDTYIVAIKSKYDYEKDYDYDVDVATYNPHEKAYIDDCWNTYNDWDEGQQYLHITHWMPLPQPPKE